MSQVECPFCTQLNHGIAFDAPLIYMAWGKPLSAFMNLGHPKISKWSRWKNRESGTEMTKVHHFRLVWQVTILTLPTIYSAKVEWQEKESESVYFQSIIFFYHDQDSMVEQLEKLFGTGGKISGEYPDKGGVIPYLYRVWRPHPTITITLQDGIGLRVEYALV